MSPRVFSRSEIAATRIDHTPAIGTPHLPEIWDGGGRAVNAHEKAVPMSSERIPRVCPKSRQEPGPDAETLQAIIEDAFNRGDLDAYAPPTRRSHPRRPARRAVRARRAAIRAARRRVRAPTPHDDRVRKKLETDGLALINTRWKLVPTDDGNRAR